MTGFPVLRWLLLALLAALAAAGAARAEEAANVPYVLDARVVGDDQRVRFVADVSAPIDAAVFALADPYRVVVDLPEVHFVLPEMAGTTGRGLVTAFRYGFISKGKSRVVIDVSGPVAIDKQFTIPAANGQPARIVVDLVPTTRQKFAEAAKAYRDSHAPEASADQAEAQGAPDLPLVVLDPGHGGIDFGARGETGTQEKDVVLAFAKVLGDKLLATNRYRVTYTRRDDSFIALGDRVKIARDQHAGLFVSIHANSFPGGSVRGAIVYTVSDEASDKMAADLANSENQSDALAGIDIDQPDSDQVKDILFDLTRRETHNFGIAFAQALVKNLGGATRMFKVPHQQASFKVLEAPDVPSALLELGYLTNAEDEKQLNSPEWQTKVADAMVAAIDAYFSKAATASANP
ncbi:MAG TPA: N-acetylmuramoyl-L-alanine amidase [Bauldia sp.]|nr:N-acetylmuramoyl-L-alanine amidase [Bauldia sp.]